MTRDGFGSHYAYIRSESYGESGFNNRDTPDMKSETLQLNCRGPLNALPLSHPTYHTTREHMTQDRFGIDYIYIHSESYEESGFKTVTLQI
ncbi:hypothetical protein AVEN_111160-1 [Araneus ventricosus]|uniref:Uncharacterized protein n=1 Tax=Araneus ventricosus TaxID=182803 RepID=A0A4Y2UZX5_ARAVE|nr:hypothetical protein AVEN_111160-1 [Araneus ventricosus]